MIGGGPAGGTAAIYAARKGIKTGIVAERLVVRSWIPWTLKTSPRFKNCWSKVCSRYGSHVREYGVDIMNYNVSAKSQVQIRPPMVWLKLNWKMGLSLNRKPLFFQQAHAGENECSG